ncbi:unnamed protein product [Adineta steineri]|uniref:Uncharacterized protein n=1 Tax=Adineta steineri TaxID=433720 RepID=A0A820A4R5_9BILA|nr:unnamed protein product [Adineta steineri]CAF4179495.1 unnamed protein product [Adineta steineri]
MPNERNLPINDNDNENQQLGVENEYNSTIINIEQFIPLSQVATDETTIVSHDMTNSMCVHLNAEAEGRTAHPTDEPLIFSLATTIVEVIDAEVINADEHNIHVNLNDVPYIQPVLNNENGNFIPLDIQNAPIGHDIADEDTVSEDVIDNPTCNINPVRSVESEDNISSSDSSDDECTSSCQSGFDSDDEGETSDDDLHTGAVLIVNDDVHTNVQDNSLSNGENLVHEQATTTGTSCNEVIETRENITTPTEGGAYSDIIPVIDLPKIVIPKSSNDIHSSDGFEEGSII